MKKIISLVLVFIMLFIGVFTLTGCENNNQNGKTQSNINNQEYVIDAKFGGKFTFEFQNDLGYEAKEEMNKITFTHKDNKSTISVYAMDTIKNSVIMREKDFAADAYNGYKTIEIAGHEAYTINRKNNYDITYGILLDKDTRDSSKYYGVKIVVSKNALKLDEFDPASFVETEAFKHLLDSISPI